MKTASQLLVDTTGKLLQDCAFNHLPDEKINLIRRSFRRLAAGNASLQERKKYETELLNFYSEADLFTETTSLQSIHQWQTVMNYFGRHADQIIYTSNNDTE
jgi:hypothetical protein